MEFEETAEVEATPTPSRTTGRRLVKIMRRTAIVVLAYLALSFLVPEVVPRAAALPEPSIGTTAPCTISSECYGERFEREGLFWIYHRTDDPGLPE